SANAVDRRTRTETLRRARRARRDLERFFVPGGRHEVWCCPGESDFHIASAADSRNLVFGLFALGRDEDGRLLDDVFGAPELRVLVAANGTVHLDTLIFRHGASDTTVFASNLDRKVRDDAVAGVLVFLEELIERRRAGDLRRASAPPAK